MKLLFKDFRKGDTKIEITSKDDLWYLSHIIDENDEVSGKTFRKIKLGGENDRDAKIIKRPVYLTISVEKIDFHRYTNSLRISGKIIVGTDDVPKGSYHTFDIDVGTVFKIHKKEWLNFQRDKLNEAAKEKLGKILLIVMDRSEATFALMKQYGFEILSELSGDVQKKDVEEKIKSNFYSEVVKRIEEYVSRYDIEKIVLGSPAFWKEDLLNVMRKNKPRLVSLTTLATCNNTGSNGLDELLKRDEVKTVLREDRAAKEISLVEELLVEISKDGKAVYGFSETERAADSGAVLKLLVTDELIVKKREDGTYGDLDRIMKFVDQTQGKICIISLEHEGGKKLSGLGGIGAILRYKLEY